MLRLFLPPNLAAAAPRDAIALKVELDLNAPLVPELLPALALLQRWAGTATPPKFLQLKRAQLRDLIAALRDRPVFFWLNGPAAPITWHDDGLSGVSIFLKAAGPASKSSTPQPSSGSTALRSDSSGATSPPRPGPSGRARLTVDGSEHYLAISLPSREASTYDSLADLVKTAGFTLDPSTRRWWLRDRHKTLNFLATHLSRLKNLDAEFTPNFEKNTAHLRDAEIVCDATEARNGFNLTLALKAGAADENQIRSAVSSNRGYIESDGKVYLLAADKLQKLDATQRALGGDAPGAGGLATRRTHAVSSARAVAAQALLEEIAPHFQPPEAWRARTDALRNLSALPRVPLALELEALLRPYQKLGIAWLWHLFRHELGGILADEMGLGKTLQAIGLLTALKSNGAGPLSPARSATERRVPSLGAAIANGSSAPGAPLRAAFAFPSASLVVCPASLVENWRREAARFAPELRLFVHHGERRLAAAEAFSAYDLVVTSYGTLTRDRTLFEYVEFACVIADEAQHIKNRRSQNAQSLRALKARGRFLLTGTPLENSLEDLRSLFEFLMPGYLDKVPPGMRGEDRAWIDERLRAQTAPYILRRTKQAVAPELPAKLEQTLWCELTPAQSKLYHETQQRTEREFLDLAASGASEASLRFAALTQLLRLRQICCDPRLIESNKHAANSDVEDGKKLAPAYNDSAKLEAFRELLAESVDDNHRILVFSQFTSLLRLLQEELQSQEIAHCYLDGTMTPRARQVEVDRFQSSPDIPIFLISLKAGGTGLNLTGADTVVHFDPWWNPAVEAQATDRAHRIGQTRVVTSYKLIASGTVEEKVLALQEEKRALLAGVFEASDAAAAKLSLADLKSLLT
ncbi:MAG: DEAD/DEAH box helicase [Opitutus sp.]